jgi:putative ABC transport system permease protein
MKIRQLIFREIRFRKVNFALTVVSAAAAVACLVGAITILRAHELVSEKIVTAKETETKAVMDKLNSDVSKSMLKLGFNVVILPKEQNLADWYADDFGSKYMPENYVTKLANSKIVTVRHLLPSLQQKILWPEKKRKIILIGTRGEVPNIHKNPKKPLVEPVPPGGIVLGYELSESLSIKTGDTVELMGRRFGVYKCHSERGSKDDITAWIYLSEAQELLKRKGQISAILALECACAWADIAKIRQEITKFLPDTQVIEKGSKAIARAEARMAVAQQVKDSLASEKAVRAKLSIGRQRFASVLVCVVILGCVVWIGVLSFLNVRGRRSEVGILRSMGYRSRQIFSLFLAKAIIVGLVGAVDGFLTGIVFAAIALAVSSDMQIGFYEVVFAGGGFKYYCLLLASMICLTPLLAAVAAWIPAMIAASEDPAEILNNSN